MKTLAHFSAAVLGAWCVACDSADHAALPPASDPCKRAQDCYMILMRDLCVDDECRNALAPPAEGSDHATCATAIRDARLRATPYARFRNDYKLPEVCRL